MKHNMSSLSLAALFAIAVVTTAFTSQSSAEDLFAVGNDNSYQLIDTANPTVVTQFGTITGFANPGEIISGIDYRANGGGIWAVTDADNVYNIDRNTFVATQVGTQLTPALVGSSFGLDYNPSAAGGSLFRIISGNTQNNRVIDSSTGGYFGTPDKTPVFYASGDANDGTTPDIQGIAYDNNIVDATSTQQFGIDASLAILTTVDNNNGTLETIGTLGLNGNLTDDLGFDVSGDTGIAFASLQFFRSDSQLYTIDLDTGAATLVGVLGDGSTVNDITILPTVVAVPEPSSALVLLAGLGAICFRRKRSA